MKRVFQKLRELFPVILCVAAFNLFAQALTAHFNLHVDLSADRLYTLSNASKEALRELDSPVKVTVLNLPSEVPVVVTELLGRMKDSARGQLDISYLDPYTHPDVLAAWQKKGLSLSLNTLVVEGTGFSRALPMSDLFETDESGNLSLLLLESRLIPVIRQASAPNLHTVQFVDGHDEDIPEELYSLLQDNGCTTSRVPLLVSPPDADLLLLTSPKRDFELSEIRRLSDYLLSGGSLVVFLGPDSASMPHLCDFLSEWGIGVTDSVIADHRQYVDGNPLLLVPVYTQHPICRIFSQIRIFPVLSQSIALTPLFSKNGNITVEKVLYSSDRGYVASGTGGTPPFTLALSSKQNTGNGTAFVVVFGSSGIYSGSLLTAPSYANAELLLQTMRYCLSTPETASLSLPSRSVVQPAIAITAGMQRTYGVLLIGLLPAAILISGAFVVWRRKQL